MILYEKTSLYEKKFRANDLRSRWESDPGTFHKRSHLNVPRNPQNQTATNFDAIFTQSFSALNLSTCYTIRESPLITSLQRQDKKSNTS